MPKLANPRHEAFARKYLELGVARQAYVAAGYKAKLRHRGLPSPADVCAHHLLRHPKVKERIEGLRAMAAKRADVTEDSLIEELEQARALALQNAQSGAAVQATMGKARITGHIIERKESGQPGDFERMNEEQLRAYIAQHLGQTMPDNADKALPETLNAGGELDSSPSLPAPTHNGTDTAQ